MNRSIFPRIEWLPSICILGQLKNQLNSDCTNMQQPSHGLELVLTNTSINCLMNLLGSFASTAPSVQIQSQVSVHKLDRGQRTHYSLVDLSELFGDTDKANSIMSLLDSDGRGLVSKADFDAWAFAAKLKSKLKEQVLIELKMSSIALVLENDAVPLRSDRMIVAEVRSLELHVLQRAYDTDLKFRIGELSIQNEFSTSNTDIKHRPLLCSLPSCSGDMSSGTPIPFVYAHFSTLSADSPDLLTSEICSSLNFTLGVVEVELNPKSIEKLWKFILQDCFGSRRNRNNELSRPDLVVSSEVDRKQSEKAPIQPSDVLSRNNRQLLQIHAECIGLRIRFLHETIFLAHLAIDRLTASHFVFESGSARSTISVQSLAFRDATPAGRHFPLIVSCGAVPGVAMGASAANAIAMTLQYNTFSRRDANYPGHASELIGSMSGLKVTFLMRFFTELSKYMRTGPFIRMQQSLPPQEHDESIMHSGSAHQSQSTFTKIVLSFADLSITVPVASTSSEESFLVSLERAHLSNSLVNQRDVSGQSFLLSVTSFCSDISLIPDISVRVKVLSDNSVYVEASLASVVISIPESRCLKYQRLVQGNLSEEAHQVVISEDIKSETTTAFVNAAVSHTAVPSVQAASSKIIAALDITAIGLTLAAGDGLTSSDHILKLQMSNVSATLHNFESITSGSFMVGKFTVFDRFTPGTVFPVLIKPLSDLKEGGPPESSSLMTVKFELNNSATISFRLSCTLGRQQIVVLSY